jgi:hypothetical protein
VNLKWARSATNIGYLVNDRATSSSIAACASSGPPANAPVGASSQLVFLGDDTDGIALEVMAVELDDETFWRSTQCQLCDRYQEQYEEAMKWRR